VTRLDQIRGRLREGEARVRRRLPTGLLPRPARPRLSVVVPVYNVEDYLAECLDSVLGQPVRDLEVVLVDDGSTDSSGAIARRYARRHRRVTLVRQANAGLGAARNAGVRAARGEYLTFLDSDDTLPADAYSAMLATIEASGSDLAVGMLVRDEPGRRFPMPRMRRNHAVRRVGVRLDEMPQILADVFAVNKLFRRSFWDAAGLEFPEGTRYEDQPALTRAFLEADRFDVLTETVYHWRIRHDGSSITQRRDDLADLRDRLLTKRSSTELVMKHAPHLERVWRTDILPVDLWEYFRATPGCSPEYWSLLRATLTELWGETEVPFRDALIPVQQRLMGWLVQQDRREQLTRLIEAVDAHAGDLPVELRGDRVVALLPGLDDAASEIPAEEFELGEHELRWEARVTEASWEGHQLRLAGFALIRNVATRGRETELTGRLLGDTGRSVALQPTPVASPEATRFAGRPSQDFDDCGFVCSLDARALVERQPEAALWRLELQRRVEQVTRSGGVGVLAPDGLDLGWHEVVVAGGTRRVRLRHLEDALAVEVAAAG
jgi:CDP-glycerol glycerophosphotransferase